MRKVPEERNTDRSLYEAQQLMYDAWDAESPRERIRLAHKALELSPLCADALSLLADEEERTLKGKIAKYTEAVEAGRKAIGREFEDLKGHFWGFHETRPYMRARYELAEHLWLNGDEEDAVTHLQEMIELNPNDNQGVRFVLVNWLIFFEDTGAAKWLISEYSEDCTSSWSYSKVLLNLAIGKQSAATKGLKVAMEANPFVPQYLLGEIEMPDFMPGAYALGSEDEAVIYCMHSIESWEKVSGALSWLADNYSLGPSNSR